jgi:predicted nucleic acid-binding protein
MFLIDSSVWIEYFRPKGSTKAKEKVRAILQKEEAVCCGIVLIEILRGAKSEKEYQFLKEALTALPQIPLDEEVIERASNWGYQLDRKGKCVSTTDLLIAAAAYPRDCLIHSDLEFKAIASIVDLKEEAI